MLVGLELVYLGLLIFHDGAFASASVTTSIRITVIVWTGGVVFGFLGKGWGCLRIGVEDNHEYGRIQ